MVNDISIISGIIILFVAVGALVPLINDSFGVTSVTEGQINSLEGNITTQIKEADNKSIEPTWLNPTGSLSIFGILVSILKMFFWTFGDLPFLIDLLIFLPLRIILVIIIARNIWVGGGG